VPLPHPTPVVGARARLRCGSTIAEPEAGGRPGQDGPAGCGQSGAVDRAGELTAVWFPDPRREAVRDLVRARLRKVARSGKPANFVTAAIARELAGFIWAITRRLPPAAG